MNNDDNHTHHKKKKHTVSAKSYKTSNGYTTNYTHSQHSSNRKKHQHHSNDLNQLSKYGIQTKKPVLTRIHTTPDMSQRTVVSLPSLMQTNTHLTPTEHAAELSPAPPQQQFPPKVLMPPNNNNSSRQKTKTPEYLRGKKLPTLPTIPHTKPLPNRQYNNTNIFIPPSLPTSKSMMSLTTTNESNGTTTTTTIMTTYSVIPQTSSDNRKRTISTGKLKFENQYSNSKYDNVPVYMPIGYMNDSQQMVYKNSYNSQPQKQKQKQQQRQQQQKHKQIIKPGGNYRNSVHNNISIYNAAHNTNQTDEYDIQYDDNSDDSSPLQPQPNADATHKHDSSRSVQIHPNNRPWSPFGIKQSKSDGNTIKIAHKEDSSSGSGNGNGNNRPRRGSDTELVAPSPSSPYHPNNQATFALYKPIAQATPITRPQSRTVISTNNNNHKHNQTIINRHYRKKVSTKSRAKTQFMSPGKNGRMHSKSATNAMPPPRNPYNNRKKYSNPVPPMKQSSYDPNNQKNIQPFPAPFVPPPPPPSNRNQWNNGNNNGMQHRHNNHSQSVMNHSNNNNTKPSFDLKGILLPGQDSKKRFEIDDDDSDDDIPLPEPTMNDGNSYKNPIPNVSIRVDMKKKKVRRNSDTIVWTPTTSSAIEDSTFMDVMNNPPEKRMHHYRARINDAEELGQNLNEATKVTPISSSTPNSMKNNVFSDRGYSISTAVTHGKHTLSLVDEIQTNQININTVLPSNNNGNIINENENKYRKRGNSAPETPTTSKTKSSSNRSTPTIPDMDNSVLNGSFPKHLPSGSQLINMANKVGPKNVSQIHHNNKKLIDKLLGFKGHTWNFDNDYVDQYFEQCKNVSYERLVPPLIDILYPTMISSLALPASVKNTSYRATIKYNLTTFVSVEEKIAQHSPILNGMNGKEERVYFSEFVFTVKTTIKMAIEEITHKIKQNHIKYNKYISKLYKNCFVLKVCGREEYIKVDDKNTKIIALNYIRNCIRKNEVQNIEMVLLYDDSLNNLNDSKMRNALKNTYERYYDNMEQKSNVDLEYENLGFNCIIDSLYDTMNLPPTNKLHSGLHKLHNDVETELLWLQRKIGSVYNNAGDSTTVAYTPVAREHAYSTFRSEIKEFEWNEVNVDAVLLPEFEHPVEFRIDSLTNIMLCPRFRMKNNEYFVYVLRIELMFGIHVFDQCSWDIIIPKNKISNNIEMPKQYCTFSTDENALNYASLPREAVWCFTLYGIKKDENIAKQIEERNKKEAKKKKKKEAKILRAFIKKQATVKSLGGLGSLNGVSGGHSIAESLDQQTHISSKPIDEDFEHMIGIGLNDFYSGVNNGTMRRSTMRTNQNPMRTMMSNIDDEEDEFKRWKSQYTSEPMAWCRLPMINHQHCLNKGELKLKMWTVEVFEKKKGGPKIDPYTTGMWKKFGSIRDYNLTKKTKLNSVVLSVNYLLNQYAFNIVAPIVNQRRPHYIRTKIKAYKKKKDYSGKGVLANIITRDGIFPMDDRDKLLVYSNKEKLMNDPATIPTFLRSVSWLDMESRMEAYDYLEKWSSPKNPEDMIELLRYEFSDNRIRLYAINCLNQLDDFQLNRCLLQLVQALKNETQHSSFLSRFLIVRALNSPYQIGHYLFWHLKSEYHDNNLQFVERYGLLLSEYLIHLPYYPLYTTINLAKQLCDESNLIKRLKFISLTIKNAKAKKKWSNKNLINLLQNELMRLNNEIFSHDNSDITLPLNPSLKVSQIIFNKCKFMSSAKVPLWLVFRSSDPYYTSFISVMFKCGDDLRQDILTLQLMSIMDAFWLREQINLNMGRTYEVIGTGYQVGMVELVLNSKTTNDINSSLLGSNKSHYKYINQKTKINKHLTLIEKKLNYSRSVAGCSVATWCLGIGDRHPDNIMIHQDGTLFHIDFGHFLGNFKEKNVMGKKWKREKTPFVFTSAMKYCIEKNDKKAFIQFVKWLFNAYCEIRVRYKFFLNLLLLMVPSQMPELISESDVSFFREILRFDLINAESIASHVENTLQLCLKDKNKQFDDMFHKIAHM